ncbi:MAG: TIGR01777 family oxidoreductase, partial [Puniceicoccales bacterium]
MKIAITGATGLVGTELSKQLQTRGDEVVPISRSVVPGGVQWDVEKGELDHAALRGVDAVVHLAGAGVADGRWTDERKRIIRDSRVKSAALLQSAIGKMDSRPSVFVSASGVGFYGPEHDAPVDETAPLGKGFLADVCREWEAAAHQFESLGLRVAVARFGVVLSPRGGALAKMLPPFKLGLGGPVGSGKQRLGWVALDDAVAALIFLIDQAEARGAFNITAPEIVTNAEFANALGKALGKPTKLPAPKFALKLAFGEMAEETLLADTPALPSRLHEQGFSFEYSQLDAALQQVIES